MSHAISRPSPVTAPKQATNVTLPETLLKDAKALGINISQACEVGLKAAVVSKHREVWLEQNQEAIEAWNEYVAVNGLPLAAFRQF